MIHRILTKSFGRWLTALLTALAALSVGLALPRTIAALGSSVPNPTDSATRAMTAPTVGQQLFKLPMRFEPNQGQTDARVKFVSRGSGYALFLTKDEAVLALRAQAAPAKIRPGAAGMQRVGYPGISATGAVFRIKLRDANRNPRIEGLQPLTSRSNYFIGSDSKQWHTGVANYAVVAYRDVYPGIDLVYHGNGQQLEYDFIVSPGMDPRQIRLSIAGADHLRIDHDGQLHMRAGASELVEHAPLAYQQVGDTRQLVQSRLVRDAENTIGFQVANYDRHLPLIIDPTLVYSTYLGGSNSDIGYGIAVDSANNAYIVGITSSTNFPVTAGAIQTTFNSNPDGSDNIFVSKLNSTGTALIYSTYLGDGSTQGYGYGIAVDSSGNAFVTGNTGGAFFPVTAGAFQTTKRDSVTAFVSKLDSSGTTLIYSTYLGGSQVDYGYSIAVDSSGDAFVTGSTASSDFPITSGALQSALLASDAAFVSKLSVSGSGLIYSTFLGGTSEAAGLGIAVDSSDNAYVTGGALAGFPITPGAAQHANHGAEDVFVSKLNSTGTALIYATYMGGKNSEYGNGIALDSSQNAYITGYTLSRNFPVTAAAGAFQTASGGSGDAFVTKLNAKGTKLIYSTYLGGSGYDQGFSIAVNSSHNAYVTGSTTSADFPITSGALQTANNIAGDAFVSELNGTGTTLLYSTYLGGSGFNESFGDYGLGIALDSSNNVYITGATISTDFPVTTGGFQTTIGSANQYDAFISKTNTAP